MAAILDAILKIIGFPMWDLGGVGGAFNMLFYEVKYYLNPLKNLLYIELKKIYNHLQAVAAILDAILKIIAFPMWDFGGLLVCYL